MHHSKRFFFYQARFCSAVFVWVMIYFSLIFQGEYAKEPDLVDFMCMCEVGFGIVFVCMQFLEQL